MLRKILPIAASNASLVLESAPWARGAAIAMGHVWAGSSLSAALHLGQGSISGQLNPGRGIRAAAGPLDAAPAASPAIAASSIGTTGSLAAAEAHRAFSSSRSAAVRRLPTSRPRPRAQPALQEPQVVAEDAIVVQPAETPASELQVASVVNHPALIVTRPIEWGTVLLGFEQANKYTVYDEQGNVVALLAEDEGSFGKAIGRQLLRTRRPFIATVFSPDGSQVIFRLRRPFYLINSTIYVEDGQGQVVGEVHQRWHLWRRNYDLYFGRRQFAAITGSFLAWDFELKDANGATLALIDRNFSGFGKELFTDAGKYVLHFGSDPQDAAQQLSNTIQAQHPDKPAPPVTTLARVSTGVEVIPTSTGNQLVVHRPLELSERMIALAAAISIDYDYFSRHSYGGGLLSPFVHPPIIPFPVPMGGGAAAGAEEAAGAAAGAEGAAGAAASGAAADAAGGAGTGAASGSEPPTSPGGGAEPLERDLGGDEWWGDQDEGDQDHSDDSGFGSGGDDGGGLFDALKDLFGD